MIKENNSCSKHGVWIWWTHWIFTKLYYLFRWLCVYNEV